MNRDAVIVVTSSLSGARIEMVARACERAHAYFTPWEEGSPLPPLAEAASLLVAGIPVGTRRIPQNVIDVVTQQIPGLTLLLLTDERLRRPSVSLQEDRVTLLGAPLTTSKVYAQIALLTGEAGDATGLDRERADVAVRACRFGAAWIGALEVDPAQRSGQRLLDVDVSTRRGATAVLGPGPALDTARLAEVIGSAASGEAVALELRNLLGSSRNALHLSADGRAWRAYWPQGQLGLSLYSAARLPLHSDLRAHVSPQEPFLEMAAAPGDLLVASAADLRTQQDLASPAARAALADGGPVFLDMLREAFFRSATGGRGLVLEVRR